jgi:uncharacterized protein involved in exopolysaccharide biosynthesis
VATAEIIVSSSVVQPAPNWVTNATLLWHYRRTLARAAAVGFILSAVIAFTMPKRYESVARIMPPDQSSSSGAAMLAALAGRSLGGLGSVGGLASTLLGGKTSSALYIDLMRSRTLSDRIIDHYDLQHVYHKRYRIETEKYLGHHTAIVEDKKSGVISITFTDTDPKRAQAITQSYLDELNKLLTHASTSSARREREFIEKRLVSVQAELLQAEKDLSEFSSVNTTLDIKEQTRAMVDAASKLQAELIVSESELDSLEQIYGNENIRVRATQARIASLKHELTKMSGSSTQPAENESKDGGAKNEEMYPSLRQIPRLAVPYANLYRNVRIQETVFELLSQQYEMARIEEAKDTPVVSVIDLPLIAEKKSFPPRTLMTLTLTMFFMGIAFVYILNRHRWEQVSRSDPRKLLANEISSTFRAYIGRYLPLRRDAQ